MVARGDLGVELPLEEVPYYQKIIIKKVSKRDTGDHGHSNVGEYDRETIPHTR